MNYEKTADSFSLHHSSLITFINPLWTGSNKNRSGRKRKSDYRFNPLMDGVKRHMKRSDGQWNKPVSIPSWTGNNDKEVIPANPWEEVSIPSWTGNNRSGG
jgi:hypothetical protein